VAANPEDFERLRQNAVIAMRANVAALVALRTGLSAQADVSSSLISTLESGHPVPAKLVQVKSHEIRPALTAAIRAFERTRHRARLRLIAVTIAEGANDQDVRELWSISQEMVRRAKREIAELDDVEVPEGVESTSGIADST
jgi:hypothetical protein